MNDYLNIIHSKEELKKCREFINSNYIASGLEKVDFIERHDYIINNNLEIEKDVQFLSEHYLHTKFEPLVQKLKEKIVGNPIMDLEVMRYFNPDCMMQVGHKIDSLQDIEKLHSDKPPIKNFVIEEGKVHIIYIWSYYKSISKKQLHILNQTYLEQDIKWEGEVKFITINIDDNKQYALNIINTLKIHRIENYYLDRTKFATNHLFKIADKLGFPICILINNDNIIETIGSLYEINLETKIRQILERHSVTVVSFYNIPFLNESEIKALKKFLSELEEKKEHLKNNHLISAPHLFGGTVRLKKSFTSGNIKSKRYSAEVNFYCHSDDEKEIMNLFRELENFKKIQFNREIVSTNEINFGEICKMCGNLLNIDIPQYYCSTCDIHLCRNCGDTISDINYPNKLHHHFLFYLHKYCDYFRRYILTYNFANKYEDVFRYYDENKTNNYLKECNTHFQVKCDGCLVYPIKSTRWKCCNCIFKNICNNCKRIIENKQQDDCFYDEIIYNLSSHGCNPLEHVFQKITIDSFVY